ncbi:hypothetical protein SDC9_118915 [bioreactor metagenome]|uniref:Uncharacterized protein n=1 Tax=bioreactor metagenome TaxID=1076179 RepID=A0A645C8E4_9ZZZZ
MTKSEVDGAQAGENQQRQQQIDLFRQTQFTDHLKVDRQQDHHQHRNAEGEPGGFGRPGKRFSSPAGNDKSKLIGIKPEQRAYQCKSSDQPHRKAAVVLCAACGDGNERHHPTGDWQNNDQQRL